MQGRARVEVLGALRACFASGRTRGISWRLEQLGALERLLLEQSSALEAALTSDLGRAETESYLSEIFGALGEIRTLYRGLPAWAVDERVPTPLVLRPARSFIRREPLGTVLVIGAWNYPINLVLVPLAAAIAAGNCVVVKPSEQAPACSALLAQLLARYLDPEAIAVVEGGAEATEALIDDGVEHVFFTGSASVGRLVMERAARQLTPVTLELGGKSPAIVAADADLVVTAQRIAWGKFMNAGQSCIAPDYVLVESPLADALTDALAEAITRLYGTAPRESPDYARIVNSAQFTRLERLLSDHGGRVVAGGQAEGATRYLAPTLVVDPEPTSALMAEEIFGPVLPIVRVASLEDAVEFVAVRPVPLALYVFSENSTTVEEVLRATRSGSVCVNTTMHQFASSALPFGGVGPSGTGTYHGRFGYERLSQQRAVLVKPTHPDPPLAYPPYTRPLVRTVRAVLGLVTRVGAAVRARRRADVE